MSERPNLFDCRCIECGGFVGNLVFRGKEPPPIDFSCPHCEVGLLYWKLLGEYLNTTFKSDE